MDVLQNFGVSWIQLIESSVEFGILVIVLYVFAYKPVLQVLDKRKAMIEKALNDAQDIETKKDDLEKEYKKILNEANKEAKSIIQNAVDQTEIVAKKITDEAKDEAKSMIERTLKDISSEKAQMYEDIKTDISSLLAQTLEKVLNESLTHEEQKKILEKALVKIQS